MIIFLLSDVVYVSLRADPNKNWAQTGKQTVELDSGKFVKLLNPFPHTSNVNLLNTARLLNTWKITNNWM